MSLVEATIQTQTQTREIAVPDRYGNKKVLNAIQREYGDELKMRVDGIKTTTYSGKEVVRQTSARFGEVSKLPYTPWEMHEMVMELGWEMQKVVHDSGHMNTEITYSHPEGIEIENPHVFDDPFWATLRQRSANNMVKHVVRLTVPMNPRSNVHLQEGGFYLRCSNGAIGYEVFRKTQIKWENMRHDSIKNHFNEFAHYQAGGHRIFKEALLGDWAGNWDAQKHERMETFLNQLLKANRVKTNYNPADYPLPVRNIAKRWCGGSSVGTIWFLKGMKEQLNLLPAGPVRYGALEVMVTNVINSPNKEREVDTSRHHFAQEPICNDLMLLLNLT